MEAPKKKTDTEAKGPDAPSPAEGDAKLVAPSGSKVKMVKIRAIREVKVGLDAKGNGGRTLKPAQYDKEGKLVKEADVAEVTEEEALDLCRPYVGTYKFSGERPNAEVERHSIARAELVKESA